MPVAFRKENVDSLQLATVPVGHSYILITVKLSQAADRTISELHQHFFNFLIFNREKQLSRTSFAIEIIFWEYTNILFKLLNIF